MLVASISAEKKRRSARDEEVKGPDKPPSTEAGVKAQDAYGDCSPHSSDSCARGHEQDQRRPGDADDHAALAERRPKSERNQGQEQSHVDWEIARLRG